MFGRKSSSDDLVDSETTNGTADEEEIATGDDSVSEESDDDVDSFDDVGSDSDEDELQATADESDGIEEEELLEDPAEQIARELDAMNDRYLRLAAEFDNYRRRTRKEAADLSVIAQMELARRILPAMDDLARVAAIPNETTTVEALDQGIELILRNLAKELAELGLERIEAVGERFDPEFHQGMMVTPTGDSELDDTVSRVFVDGYQLRGRLVRPAQVEVLNFEAAGDEDA